MIKVMTFNVRYGEAEDGANSWPHRKDHLIAQIQAHDPDLLGMQETDQEQGPTIAAGIGEGWVSLYGERLDTRRPDGHGKTVCYRRARFEEVAHGSFWISETPEVPGSILQPNQWGERTVCWVRLRERTGGRELVFAVSHFDTHPGCLLRSAEIAGRELASVTGTLPVIFVADFNAPADSPAYCHLTGPAGFRDAWREAGVPEQGVVTFNGWTMVAHHPDSPDAATAYLRKKYGKEGNGPHHVEEYGRLRNERIDWVLVKGGLVAKSARADSSLRDGRYASDHFAVVAGVDWAR